MLLGFISLLLTVFQDRIARICITEKQANEWLPCEKKKDSEDSPSSTHHLQTFFTTGHLVHRLLAEAEASAGYCSLKVLPQYTIFNGVVNQYSNLNFII